MVRVCGIFCENFCYENHERVRMRAVSDRREKVRARARMWLRGERAFGVDALPVSLAVAQAEPRNGQVASPTTSIGEKSNLFGISEDPVLPTLATIPTATAPQQGFTAPILSTEQKRIRLLEMDEKEVRGCTRCRLCESRTQTVFGEGNADAAIFFIGEGPGETEDRTGRPFVGRAGELLDRMIVAMGLKREQVYIANIVKCRPPGNREPAPDEVAACTGYLERQIEIVRPKVIVTLGRPALQHMLQQKISITKIRGQWQSWRGIKLMPTFHPAYILRQYTPETRAAVWSDLQQVMTELGLPAPGKRREKEV